MQTLRDRFEEPQPRYVRFDEMVTVRTIPPCNAITAFDAEEHEAETETENGDGDGDDEDDESVEWDRRFECACFSSPERASRASHTTCVNA